MIMLTSEAAIKAIIESVIKKCQQPSQQPEQITTGPSENLSHLSSSDHNLTNCMNLPNTGRAEGDMDENPTSEHYYSSLWANDAGTEAREKTTSHIGEKNKNAGNLGEED